jgi:signal transduction histidine kinase
MIKTLYVRVVLTFLAAVIFGLVSAFFLTTYFYLNLVREEMQDDMTVQGNEIAVMFTRLGEGNASDYLKSISMLMPYYITLYDKEGRRNQYGTVDPREDIAITEPTVKLVLNGTVYRSALALRDKIVVGLPFQKSNESYALFLQSSHNKKEGLYLRKAVSTALIITLLMGSLFIFVAARYVVKPLRAMTEATRRMSKGDFHIDWKLNRRKDELGMLAQSFSEMALELKQMEQMRQDFVSNVSHEIQTPLTSISGFSKVLRNGSMPEEERQQYLDIIESESERLSRLSENLLKLASLESEHHPYQPHTYDMDEQIRRVIVACEPQWSAKRIEFELTLPTIKIRADEDLLNQVWLNLIGNSIKFSPDGGVVYIGVRRSTNEIEVTIADQGMGISGADQERIFERFFKVDRSRTGAQSGSGLGLAIVNKIVLLHKGTITMQSEPGQGSTFTVILPSIPEA